MFEEELINTDLESQIEEITLDTPRGLLQFVDHIEEQYDEFLLLKDSLRTEPSAQALIFNTKDAYQRLVENIKEVFIIFESGQTLNTSHAIAMQEIYNEFVDSVATLEVQSFSDSDVGTSPEITSVESETKIKTPLSEMFPARELSKDSIVTEKLMRSPRYQKLIQEHFSSPFAFEAALWRLIKRVEEPSQLDRLLGVRHGSLFKEILKGMTAEEVSYFNSQPGENIRAALIQMEKEDSVQYDYRTYVAWMDEFDYMKHMVEHYGDTPFEDLLAMSELERLSDLE